MHGIIGLISVIVLTYIIIWVIVKTLVYLEALIHDNTNKSNISGEDYEIFQE